MDLPSTTLCAAVTKKFGVDFNSKGGALTLEIEEVTADSEFVKHGMQCTRTHDDGWTISGEIREDYFEWVNEFEASHPIHGRVWGDFEIEVHADSEEGFQDFYANHEPHAWDYSDI